MSINKMTRRQALKTLLAAGTGLAAAGFLPAKWVKPVVLSGVLPVHARASGYSFSNPAEVGNNANVRNGHQITTVYDYIYYNYDNVDFMNSTITAKVMGAAVSGIDVELNFTNIVGTVTYGYMVSGAMTYTFPLIKTTGLNGEAKFPLLLESSVSDGATFDITFTYKRGGTTINVNSIPFTVKLI